MIDKAIIYVPISQKSNNIGADNELEKRNISLEYLKENDCNYLIDLDCDEFYLSDKLKDAIKYIDYFGYDSAFCKMKTYYRYADCEIIPAENYYVPCLYKINKNSKFELIENYNFPVLCDQTRKMKTKLPYVFSRDELEMHHYSYVRKDINSITSKFKNSSCIVDYDNTIFNQLINDWDNYQKESFASISINGEKITLKKTKIVENLFNIQL